MAMYSTYCWYARSINTPHCVTPKLAEFTHSLLYTWGDCKSIRPVVRTCI